MKNFILICISFLLVNAGLIAQNVECIGNPINISMTDYKIGTIQWQFSANGQDWVDLAGKTSTDLTYNVIETGYFRTKVTYGDCDFFADSIKIVAYPVPTLANAGQDQNILNADTEVILSANAPAVGKGKWSVISGVGGSFDNDTVPNTTFTGSQCKDYLLRWTISTACKSYTDDVTIGFHAEPTIADAGQDQSLVNSDTLVNLSANTPVVGTGKWTVVSGVGGSFVNDTVPNTTFTGSQCKDYLLRWTISTACKSYTDDVSIGFHAEPTLANAGQDQSLINSDTVVILSANAPGVGKGKWSVVSGGTGSFTDETNPNATFTGFQCTDYVLQWAISTHCKNYIDNVNIGFHAEPTVANAGNDIITTDSINFLTANTPDVGIGHWTIVSGEGGFLENDTIPTTRFIGFHTSEYILRWTISNNCKQYSDELNIRIIGQKPSAEVKLATNITTTSATLNGNVNANYLSTKVSFEYGLTTNYGSSVVATQNPVTGSSSVIVSAEISQLEPGATYHFRINAINELGTSVSDDNTVLTPSIMDIDGNGYYAVTIGTQIWMTENLKTTKYNDNSDIPLVEDLGAWVALTTPGYCWYNNDATANKATYGALYNWYSVNTGKLCPTGWHIPTDAEWKTLEMFLGMTQAEADTTESRGTDQGTQLKNTSGWYSGGNGTNTSGFSALPGGIRTNGGLFYDVGVHGYWLSSTEYPTFYAWIRILSTESDFVSRIFINKECGYSVRCLKDSETTVLTTLAVSAITETTATTGGNISSDGGAAVTERGVCYSTTPGPTISNSIVTGGTGSGSFVSELTGLTAGTTYYVRAYAANSEGTAYGNEISFTTLAVASPITDVEGNTYNTVNIGTQTWMAENLKTTLYNDGTSITYPGTDNIAWRDNTIGAYAWYGNEATYKDSYGALYNWHTVNTGKLCPAGYHVPTDAEWTVLTDYLGGEAVAGGKLKEAGMTYWLAPNTSATNETGFSALPGGLRHPYGSYSNIDGYGSWWSSTECSTLQSWYRDLYYSNGNVFRDCYADKRAGFSVRCIKD